MDFLQPVLSFYREFIEWLPDPVAAILVLTLAALIALSLHRSARKVVRHLLAQRFPYTFSIITRMRGITLLALLILCLSLALPLTPLDPVSATWIGRVLLMSTIALIGWGALTALRIGADLYLLRFRLDVPDNLLARKHVTQVRILRRASEVLVIVITLAAALMTFEPVRQYGVSLFASAGVAGIVVGLAARPVLSNLIAGVQLAMTQPIRIDDAVIVENEWGQIEQINATYVVVRLWDLRRLIVPLTYFIEKPFQNWTHEGAALVGSVLLYLDYTAPIGAIREKLPEILESCSLWNRQTAVVQVTDCKDDTIEVRILVSANSAGATFNLRCEVREKLLDFLQREHPYALPRRRQQQIDDSGHGLKPLAARDRQRVSTAPGEDGKAVEETQNER